MSKTEQHASAATAASGRGPATPDPARSETGQPSTRAPYTRPVLEHLGSWTALTLQQSVPIFP
jgi:hypothetical protein